MRLTAEAVVRHTISRERNMASDMELEIPYQRTARYLTLRPETIEKTISDCVMDLKEVIVLDGIDILPDNSGFRVRCHDLHGPLPEIVVKDSGDTFVDKDRLGREACKLVAISRLRDRMTRWLSGGKFLPPTTVDNHATVGFKVGPKTWIVEGDDFITPYHDLHEQVVG
jgi:hypothetical protein